MTTPRCLVCGCPDAPVKELQVVRLRGWEYLYRFHLCRHCHEDLQRQARVATMLKLRLAWQARTQRTL